MNLIHVREIEDCFDASLMREVLFDAPITPGFIRFWQSRGELDYFPAFARPFFRVHVPGRYYLKGIQGNKTLRLILYKNDPPANLQTFLDDLKHFQCPSRGK